MKILASADAKSCILIRLSMRPADLAKRSILSMKTTWSASKFQRDWRREKTAVSYVAKGIAGSGSERGLHCVKYVLSSI